ncbi:MAG: aspartate 1-decarboxylase [Proteobacteria bacterium]|nr:aspartate 1-decarboxylase [Pseudomonadota bacterium]
MLIELLHSKIHRATVTCANLHYQGSISIDVALCRRAGLVPWQRVDIYDINNGARFSTYVMYGEPGEITLNGAAARCVQVGDLIIIAAYATMTPQEAETFQPAVVLVDANNQEIQET